MLKAVIIDDEPDCVKLLALQLKMYCKNVVVSGECTEAEDGLATIKAVQPDIVFLDIEMPVMNGFQLLEKIGSLNFSLIFVTAYDQFAVKAFRFSALDYLLKPVDPKDLIAALEKAGHQKWTDQRQISHLKNQLHTNDKFFPERIALPFQNGVTFVELKEVVYCESDNNYTKFHLVGNQQHTVAKTLGNIQEILEEGNFLRVHRQYLINLNHISKFVRGEACYLLMSTGETVPVARSQKEKLMKRFGWL